MPRVNYNANYEFWVMIASGDSLIQTYCCGGHADIGGGCVSLRNGGLGKFSMFSTQFHFEPNSNLKVYFFFFKSYDISFKPLPFKGTWAHISVLHFDIVIDYMVS